MIWKLRFLKFPNCNQAEKLLSLAMSQKLRGTFILEYAIYAVELQFYKYEAAVKQFQLINYNRLVLYQSFMYKALFPKLQKTKFEGNNSSLYCNFRELCKN